MRSTPFFAHQVNKPPTHTSLTTCLHQILAMPGIQKPAINTIQSVAFLLNKLEETQINTTVKEAIDNHINKPASDTKLLIEDVKVKLTNHIKTIEDQFSKNLTTTTTPIPQQPLPKPPTYASILINPPAHTKRRHQSTTVLARRNQAL